MTQRAVALSAGRRRGPAIGAVCGIVYAVSHAWWTATGAPPFVHAESVFVAGWPLVGLRRRLPGNPRSRHSHGPVRAGLGARDGGLGSDTPGGSAFVLFVALMVLPWARKAVPRWIVLGPGPMMSIGLLAYFGAGGTTALLLGKTSGELLEAVGIAGYVIWGTGLSIASISYARLTKPECEARVGAHA